MNIILLLLIILFVVMVIVGGKRGVRSFFTLLINFLILLIMVILIGNEFDPIKVTAAVCIVITYISLIYINGFNIKTISSLISVTIVVLLTMLMTYKIGNDARVQGFGTEQSESIAFLSSYVQLDFGKIVVSQILIGLLGAIIDVSISISSSMFELYKSDLSGTKDSIFKSGMNIGRDILGTMTNTLLFAYIGEFMALIIYFSELHYSLGDVLNAKVFCSEVFQVLCGGIGVILIIPVTAVITSAILFSKFSLKQD